MTVVTWTGRSGLQYRMEAFPAETIFNPVSGVYIAFRALSTGNFEALYVGEAQSLYQRLNARATNHTGLRCAAGKGMTHICATVVVGDTERLRVETDLRHGLDPSCNRQGVPRGLLPSMFDL